MSNPDWYDSGFPHIWLPYTQMKTVRPALPASRTYGTRIVLADGRELIDGVASWWTAAHGYNHPHIAQAVEAQLKKMPHVMLGGLVHEPALTLAERLSNLLPGTLNHVFFSDSGSVAVEVAMKMATQYWLNRGARGRTKFIAFKGGYHGDTIATMSVCDPEEGMHSLFTGVLPEHYVIDLPRDDETAAAFPRAPGRARSGSRRASIASAAAEKSPTVNWRSCRAAPISPRPGTFRAAVASWWKCWPCVVAA